MAECSVARKKLQWLTASLLRRGLPKRYTPRTAKMYIISSKSIIMYLT